MKVYLKEREDNAISDMSVGQCFLYEGDLYIKVEANYEVRCSDCDEWVDANPDYRTIALCVATGYVVEFELCDYGECISCEIREV